MVDRHNSSSQEAVGYARNGILSCNAEKMGAQILQCAPWKVANTPEVKCVRIYLCTVLTFKTVHACMHIFNTLTIYFAEYCNKDTFKTVYYIYCMHFFRYKQWTACSGLTGILLLCSWGLKGSTIIMQLPTEMFRFQLPSPITAAYAARHSHAHCVFLVYID